VLNMPTRLAALKRDPWADFRKQAAALETKKPSPQKRTTRRAADR
jgi:bifunctional non-homologous end joining protein LigD